jgi:methionyl-tRNA formyltransferase
MDTGPVLLSDSTPVRTTESSGELTDRLADLGAPLLVAAMKGFVAGSIVPEPQDHDRATFASKITPDDALIDWTTDADTVDRRIRAYQPVPGAHTTFDGARLKVHRARPVAGRGEPGRVVRVDRADGDVCDDGDIGGPVVACGQGAVRLDEVQPAGKPRISGLAFANGYRPEGSRLGVAGSGGDGGSDGKGTRTGPV